jgi:hypothetical protein
MIKVLIKSSPFLFVMILGLLVLTSLSRLLPHPWNFSPLGAMAIFGGATIGHRYLNMLIPLFFVWASDLLVNNILYKSYFNEFVWFYDGFYWQYVSYLLISFLAYYAINSFKFHRIILFSVFSSILFFLISNFGVWASGGLYPPDFQGLISCYVAGLPFLKGNLLGDLVYTSVLFGVYYIAGRKFFVKGLA